MELVNEFRVPVAIDKAWEVLTDVQRIAPCIPGAELLSVDGDDFTGRVKVKVGPISVAYQGNGTFLEKDAGAHRAVIKGTAKETRGQGNAAAIITCALKGEGDSTACVISTDLTISGKAAQFGRGRGQRAPGGQAVRGAAAGVGGGDVAVLEPGRGAGLLQEALAGGVAWTRPKELPAQALRGRLHGRRGCPASAP